MGEGDNYCTWIEDRASKGKMPSHERSFMPGQIKLKDKLEPVPQLLGLKYEYESEPEKDDSNSSICEDVEGATAWETEEHPEPDIQEIMACPACQFTDVTQKAIIAHVKTAHPDFRLPLAFVAHLCFHLLQVQLLEQSLLKLLSEALQW